MQGWKTFKAKNANDTIDFYPYQNVLVFEPITPLYRENDTFLFESWKDVDIIKEFLKRNPEADSKEIAKIIKKCRDIEYEFNLLKEKEE